jgi:hypothetical protein
MKELSSIDKYYLTEHDWEEVRKRLKEIEHSIDEEVQRRITEEHELSELRPYFDLTQGNWVKRNTFPPVINPVLDLYNSENRLEYDKRGRDLYVHLRPKGDPLTRE